jgi:hypothetical protein
MPVTQAINSRDASQLISTKSRKTSPTQLPPLQPLFHFKILKNNSTSLSSPTIPILKSMMYRKWTFLSFVFLFSACHFPLSSDLTKIKMIERRIIFIIQWQRILIPFKYKIFANFNHRSSDVKINRKLFTSDEK